ncbi:winged helix-turn-helix domain-containing protein [Dokdonella sp.]|uniref:ArsR/SmtB family transcription factor n=1 Tax=Dokdonella sp. TaxID=2291710 RepID=UPI001B238CB7|nr:winged helix-turn-helix domain-containing protein [Dokdonella sp.]MBO9661763.1 winged helix-turn-helix transcriptional regulator [Dokdonella sp.]
MSSASPLTQFQLAELGGLFVDPARAAILLALIDGSARPATELATLAGVAAPTASEHLRKLVEGGLLTVLAQGRHRYYRLAGDEVAHLLETLVVLRSGPRQATRVAQAEPALAYARTCYGHLAGRLGVALFERLRDARDVQLEADSLSLTRQGAARLREVGLLGADEDLERLRGRSCLDWTERRFHLAGALGCELTRRLLERRWLRRVEGSRSLALSATGRAGLRALRIDLRTPPH